MNQLIPPNSDWTLSTANKVNNAGWIVGVGTRAGLGGTRSFVAKPK